MKKLISLFLSVLLLLTLGTAAFADEKPEEIDVYVKYVREIEGEYTALPEDGAAEVTTDQDMIISVWDIPENAVLLVVVPIKETETSAWQWITECLQGTGTPLHTFEIYFLDKDGNRISADGVTVMVDCPHCTKKPTVCSLTPDGKVSVLSNNTRSISVSFTTDGSEYYIMTEAAANPTGTPDVTGTPNPTETPNVTGTPNPTEAPNVTGTPEPTEAPNVTGTPEPTEAPNVTGTPNPTEAPNVTGTPEPTEAPNVTGTPEPTEAPNVTGTPEPTEAPNVSTTPEPTETPTDSAAAPTGTPKVSPAPEKEGVPPTGDESPLGFMGMLLAISAVVLIFVNSKKRHNVNDTM